MMSIATPVLTEQEVAELLRRFVRAHCGRESFDHLRTWEDLHFMSHLWTQLAIDVQHAGERQGCVFAPFESPKDLLFGVSIGVAAENQREDPTVGDVIRAILHILRRSPR